MEPIARPHTTASPWARIAVFGLVGLVAFAVIVLPSGVLSPGVSVAPANLESSPHRLAITSSNRAVRLLITSPSSRAGDAERQFDLRGDNESFTVRSRFTTSDGPR